MKPSKNNKNTSKAAGPKGKGKTGDPVMPETPKPAAAKSGSKTPVVKSSTKPTVTPNKPATQPKPPAAKPEIKAGVDVPKAEAKPITKKKVAKAKTASPLTTQAKPDMPLSSTPPKPAGVESNSGNLMTTVDVHLDAGFGNTLFIRGEGAGLSWEQGIPLTNIDSKTWRWTCETKAMVSFKILLNDVIWASGEDLVVPPGEKIVVTPEF